MGLFIILIINLYINVSLSPDSTAIKIEYNLPEGVQKIQVFYQYKGNNYLVGVFNNPFPEKKLKDFFIWKTRKKWRGKGDLKVAVYYINKKTEEYFISGKNLKVQNFLPFSPEQNQRNERNKRSKRNKLNKHKTHFPPFPLRFPDPYAWRMVGYDAQHTGYYPFPVYPPLELRWVRDWSGSGIQITEVSGCAGQGMLFIPHAPWEINAISAVDIETGQGIWKRTVTANAMTSVLSEGDSILFVGTWIGFTPDSDTTFYAFDPFTGDLKWAKIGLGSVQYSPVTIDSFVYPPLLQEDTVYAYTLKGNFVWKARLTRLPPAYYNGKIYGPKEPWYWNPDDTTYIFYCRDALTGDSL